MTGLVRPSFTDTVETSVFLEPLGSVTLPEAWLERFPDGVYYKAPDTHFMRFMYVLLGPTGIGWLQQNLLLTRLRLEAHGAELFDLDSFYGDPFKFGRILQESFADDITGLLPVAVWNRIRAQDEAYRSRAIQFFNAARLGTTPEGMKLAAASGTGQLVDVIENYRALFDSHSDDLLGLQAMGYSQSLGEFVIAPLVAVSRSVTQTLSFDPDINSGSYFVVFNGRRTPSLPYNSDPSAVEAALQALPIIGTNAVRVTGDPGPTGAMVIAFTGALSNQDVPTLTVQSDIAQPLRASGLARSAYIQKTSGALSPVDERSFIPEADQHHMQVALDRLRPVASYPTFRPGRSSLTRHDWQSVSASSERSDVVRFVTGTRNVTWPALDNTHWIETNIEKEAPQLQVDNQQHYVGFHNISTIRAYTDDALSDPTYLASTSALPRYTSVHLGSFPDEKLMLPFLGAYDNANQLVFTPERCLADYPEPLLVTLLASDATALINGMYPSDYLNLQGVPQVAYKDEHFWASRDRPTGAEILEIDLGSPQAVNFISLEVTRKPIDIQIEYDLLDQTPARLFVPIIPNAALPYESGLHYDPNSPPWQHLQYYFDDGGQPIFTRYLRLTFARRTDSTTFGRYLYDSIAQAQRPWGINVRNLRIGRNVPPSSL